MLTKRLETIKNLVNNSKITVDVGTDHGYVPISLITEKRALKVIACDINKGPLNNARANIQKAGLFKKIELRLGGGLVPCETGEADTVIIAGMGGILIKDILEESYIKAQSAEKLILQPMNSQDVLREYLINNNFSIKNEHLAIEGEKFYNIIEVVPKKETKDYLKESFLNFGNPQNFEKNEQFKIYTEKNIKRIERVLTNLKKAKNYDENEVEKLKNILAELEEYYA